MSKINAMEPYKKLLSFIIILCANCVFSQLSGNAQLTSQGNHSGIKVKFIANSGTAVTDSTLTDASGNYSINISGGVYYVQMSKPGYQTVFYNNNTSFVLTNTVTLNTVTLIPGNLVSVNGNVSGNWTNNNTYIVNGNVTVPAGSTLNIQPGTVIKVAGHYTITANGALIADASAGNKITFTSNQPSPAINDWYGIIINGSNSNITNCLIEYPFNAVEVNNVNCPIISNDVRFFNYCGIYINGGASPVKFNKVHDYTHYFDVSIGINLISTSLVECNEVYNGVGYGIRPVSSCIVRHNVVKNIVDPTNQRGFGIGLNIGSPTINNNIVTGCSKGLMLNTNINTSPHTLVTNNTIHSNTIGIMLTWGDCCSNAIIVNNIVVNNVYGLSQNTGTSTTGPISVSHNCVWNNSSANYNSINITGVGQTVSTNSNGDPIDSYFNISMDPKFLSNTIASLDPTSPCLNAGDPNYSTQIGCNTSMICDNISIRVTETQNNLDISVYPNPFSDNIVAKVSVDNVTLSLKDILGKDITVNVLKMSNEELKVETTGLNRGIYFLILTNGSSSKTVKLIKN